MSLVAPSVERLTDSAPDMIFSCHTNEQGTKLLVFPVKIHGIPGPCKVLVDCGASQNYARRDTLYRNKDLFEKSLLPGNRTDKITVRMADGSTKVTPKLYIELKISFLDFTDLERLYVLDLDDRYDIILGMPWLQKHQPWIDWKNKTLGSSTNPREPFYYGALVSHDPSPMVLGDLRQDSHDEDNIFKTSAFEAPGAVKNDTPSNIMNATEIRNINRTVKQSVNPPMERIKAVPNNTGTEGDILTLPKLGVEKREVSCTGTSNGKRKETMKQIEGLICNECNLLELPSDAREAIILPEMKYDDFLMDFKKGNIRSLAILGVTEEEQSLLSTSTMDTTVDDTKISRYESQGWNSLRGNPYYELLKEFQDVFPDEVPSRLPKDKGIKHEITLEPGTKYCVTRQWPLPREQVQVIDDFFAARYAAGQVRESKSPHCSPTFCVKKATGGWRIVHAFNKVNAATVPEQTPIPRKDMIIDSMSGSVIFSTIDLRDSYYQILMDLASIPLTAVSTPSGMLWEWLVMPQGLKNAPATFNRCASHLLRPCRSFAPSYFDDIYIHSKPEGEHTAEEVHKGHLRKVLEIMRKHGLYANIKKCMFGMKEIPVLGDFVGINGVRADPEKIKTITEWPIPQNVKDLRKWLGLATYLHKYTPNFALIARSLTDLLRLTSQWKWTTEHDKSFQTIKDSLMNAPVLALPDYEKPFSVVCDASDFTIGGALMQVDNQGINRPVYYISRQLKAAEINYPVHDKELLSMKYALVKFRVYLLGGKPFVIYTDHASLRTAIHSPHLSQRMARWLSFFAEYNFSVAYKPGRENILADALSRRPDLDPKSSEINHISASSCHLYDRIRNAYDRDESCKILVDYFANNNEKSLTPRLRSKIHRYNLHQGLLLFQVATNDEPRIVIPDDDQLKHDILYEYHDTVLSGHLGREKTYLAVCRNFWWPRLSKYIAKYVRTCEICQRVKSQPSLEAPLQSLPIPSECWKSISMDFIFGLPVDSKGRTGILVFVDRLSKMVHLAPVREKITANEAAVHFFNDVFRHHGLPETIVSDRDPRFTSKFWKSLFELLGTKLNMSTADHPETDGQTERVNRVLVDILRSFCAENPKDWSTLLPSIEFAMNNSVHSSTGHTAFYVNYLRHPLLPQTLNIFNPNLGKGDITESTRIGKPEAGYHNKTAEDFVDTRLSTINEIRDRIANAQDIQKEYSDRVGRKLLYSFKVGDKVLLSTKNLPAHAITNLGSNKLLPRYIGPFKIIEQINPSSYRLGLPRRMRTHPTFYVGRLKPYHEASKDQNPPLDASLASPESEKPHASATQPLTEHQSSELGDALTSDEAFSPRELRRKSHSGEGSSPLDQRSTSGSYSIAPGADDTRLDNTRYVFEHPSTLHRGGPVRTPPPPIIDSTGAKHYIVESLKSTRRHRNRVQHLISWVGYGPEHDSWVDRDILLEDIPGLVSLYDEKQKK